MSFFEAVIIAIVEGLTEFLPISSTGHMIITQSLLGAESDEFSRAFIVSIQLGAILSVVVLYWKRFFQTIGFYYKLFFAFIPAAVIGLLFGDYVDMMLESVLVVAVSLVVGGVVLLFVDQWFKNSSEDTPTNKSSFVIGLFQCIAMIPGVSRSAATIVGGMAQKLNRRAAAEFSFFLAVPTMFAATGYKLYKSYHVFNAENLNLLIVGNLVSFVVAMIAIKGFIGFLTRYGFKGFGYYRIIVGTVIIIMLALGYDLAIVG
jgi:undecaprenyl-diphosphatase